MSVSSIDCWAWLDHENFRFRARGGPQGPALWNLLTQVGERFPHQARKILRKPISVNYLISPFEKEALRVLGKRVRFDDLGPAVVPVGLVSGPIWDSSPVAPDLEENGHRPLTDSESVFSALTALLEQGPQWKGGHDRPVGALLLDRLGRCKALARNRHSRGRHWHAEIQILWRIRTGELTMESGDRLFVTLKPCRMCAALADELGVTAVHYFEEDRGPWSRNTRLDSVLVREVAGHFV